MHTLPPWAVKLCSDLFDQATTQAFEPYEKSGLELMKPRHALA